MACRPEICLMFTSRLGVVISSFIRESRSLPPARISTSPQLLPNSAGTCCAAVGLVYSNGRIVASLRIERSQHAIWRDRHEGTTHADGVGDSVVDCSHWANGGRFTQADRPTLVITLAGHHVDHQFSDIANAGKTVEIHIWIEHAPSIPVHNFFFVERCSDSHNHGTVNLAFSSFHADDEPAILYADHLVHFDDAGFRIDRDISHYSAAYAAGNQIARTRIFSHNLDWLCSQPRASIFPTHAA